MSDILSYLVVGTVVLHLLSIIIYNYAGHTAQNPVTKFPDLDIYVYTE